jgi:Asp-tRNA(Asn)/Glu-tRNA(Gln) amidotransferase A subunit family amidase
MTPTDISVVGPMARHAENLDMALRALAGADLLQRAAWRVELQPPRHRRLGEFRVAVWASSRLCRIDTSVSDLFDRAINAIVRAGATVDDAARPGIADEEHHRLFMQLLRAATASRMRGFDRAFHVGCVTTRNGRDEAPLRRIFHGQRHSGQAVGPRAVDQHSNVAQLGFGFRTDDLGDGHGVTFR